MAEKLEEGGIQLVSLEDNLVDRIWTEEDGREPFTVDGRRKDGGD